MTERLCRLTAHWFGLGWVPGWIQYLSGHRVYYRRCRHCGAES